MENDYDKNESDYFIHTHSCPGRIGLSATETLPPIVNHVQCSPMKFEKKKEIICLNNI